MYLVYFVVQPIHGPTRSGTVQEHPHLRHSISITVGPSLTNGPSGFFIAVATRSLPQTGHLHFSFIDSASSIIEKRSAEYAADDDPPDAADERAEHAADAGRVHIVVIVVAIIGFIVFRIISIIFARFLVVALLFIGIILAEFTFCVELFRIIVCGIFALSRRIAFLISASVIAVFLVVLFAFMASFLSWCYIYDAHYLQILCQPAQYAFLHNK